MLHFYIKLQIAFENGLLKDGLNVAVQPIQKGVNDIVSLNCSVSIVMSNYVN